MLLSLLSQWNCVLPLFIELWISTSKWNFITFKLRETKILYCVLDNKSLPVNEWILKVWHLRNLWYVYLFNIFYIGSMYNIYIWCWLNSIIWTQNTDYIFEIFSHIVKQKHDIWKYFMLLVTLENNKTIC